MYKKISHKNALFCIIGGLALAVVLIIYGNAILNRFSTQPEKQAQQRFLKGNAIGRKAGSVSDGSEHFAIGYSPLRPATATDNTAEGETSDLQRDSDTVGMEPLLFTDGTGTVTYDTSHTDTFVLTPEPAPNAVLSYNSKSGELEWSTDATTVDTSTNLNLTDPAADYVITIPNGSGDVKMYGGGQEIVTIDSPLISLHTLVVVLTGVFLTLIVGGSAYLMIRDVQQRKRTFFLETRRLELDELHVANAIIAHEEERGHELD